jgi:hypothetical protein
MLKKTKLKLRSRRWIPISRESVITTNRYKYILGLYEHDEYGRGCFRISKYAKENDLFVGHFVVVPEDQDIILPQLIGLAESALKSTFKSPTQNLKLWE